MKKSEDSFVPLGVEEIRSHMQCYLSKQPGKAIQGTNYFRVDFEAGKWYLGVESALGDDFVFTWYFMPTGDREAMIFICLGPSDPFDNFIYLFEDHIAACRDSAFIEKMNRLFPKLMEAIMNTQAEKFSKPALMELQGPEHKVACLGMKMREFNLLLPHYWSNDDACEKAKRLWSYAEDISDELNKQGIRNVDELVVFGRKHKVNRVRQAGALAKLLWRVFKDFS